MTKRFSAVIALMLALSAPAAAQGPKVPPCDSAGALAKAPEVYKALRATLNTTCGSYQLVVTPFSDSTWTAKQLVAYLLHGTTPFPPTRPDTAIVPPKDTTPAPTPIDTTTRPLAWTGKHYAAGSRYLIPGYRRARWTYADTSGAVYGYSDGDLKCGYEGFNNTAPRGSGASYCELSEILTEVIPVTMAMGPITASALLVPKGGPGSGAERIQNGGGSGTPSSDGFGAFRTTCTLAKYAFDDPIANPRQPGAAHLHAFFGFVGVNAFTDSTTVKSGNSTCRGGALNRSSYWTPAWLSADNQVVPMKDGVFYYKNSYGEDVTKTQPMPFGLQIIAGNKLAIAPQFSPDGLLQITQWDCLSSGAHTANHATIPICNGGDTLRLTVYFPSCWDNKRLTSADQSHMAYPDHRVKPSACPATHPVQLPEISEHFDAEVPKGTTTAGWRISSDTDPTKPGISAHADWLLGWKPEIMKAFVANCINKRRDGGVGGLCDGRSLY